jgi:hypothetical protein
MEGVKLISKLIKKAQKLNIELFWHSEKRTSITFGLVHATIKKLYEKN